MKPILDLTIQESLRDNLLSCSCQEYFEIMRKVSWRKFIPSIRYLITNIKDNIRDLIEECMTKHEAEIQHLAKTLLGGELFQRFILRHEMNMAPRPQEPTSKQYVIISILIQSPNSPSHYAQTRRREVDRPRTRIRS